jgi:hypothetical protein
MGTTLLMIAAMLILGAHDVIDVVGGMAVAAGIIVLVQKLSRVRVIGNAFIDDASVINRDVLVEAALHCKRSTG